MVFRIDPMMRPVSRSHLAPFHYAAEFHHDHCFRDLFGDSVPITFKISIAPIRDMKNVWQKEEELPRYRALDNG